jgi:hypothetical protein
MNVIPTELNWVEKRAACTAEKMFTQLVLGINEDIKARNIVGADSQFAAGMTSDQKVLIVGEAGTWARKEKLRIFPLDGKVEVRNEFDGTTFSARVFLNDEGRCKLRLEDGTELEQWQFRKKALESLFFGD